MQRQQTQLNNSEASRQQPGGFLKQQRSLKTLFWLSSGNSRRTGRGLHYLGNITHQVNTANSVVAEYSYDAWGRRRDKDDWSYTLTSEPALFADRGFTGHEYLADFNLYNMNGRLYDPVVGRFLSPDPQVQDPYYSQSYNRYSYCLNNPLKYNDPRGEVWWILPVIFAGNYAINWLDNTINKGMSAKEAFQQTAITADFNFSPSTQTFSNTQVDAYTAAAHLNVVSQKLDQDVNKIRAANGGGGIMSDVSSVTKKYTSPTADFFGGAVESKIGQILVDRGKYGRLHPETVIRTPVVNINVPTKFMQNTGTALKWGGRAFGAVGLVGTYAQWETGEIGNAEAALDATFGVIGFMPGYGWAVSGTYFLVAKPLYNYYTKP